MTNGTVHAAGWSLDDVNWSAFDRTKLACHLVEAVKAASLVEYNAADYVDYLRRVYRDAPLQVIDSIERWGREEIQHGQALGRWAQLADPSFNLEEAFVRFRAGYRPAHFVAGAGSVRGSKRGEMIARCVVESGTSSFYSAIRDASREPVLKEIAGRIAADEFRHYRLFYELLEGESEPDLPLWKKLWVAVTRVNESDDDELSYAYYCANVPPALAAATPYNRRACARAYHERAMKLYRRHHIDKLVKMVVKPVGLNPAGRVSAFASRFLWWVLTLRAGWKAAA